MSTPLDPAEITRVRSARAAAFERQEDLIEQARVGEIEVSQMTDLLGEIDWPRWSRWTLGPCMPGCAIEHGPKDALEDEVFHEVFVAYVPTTQPSGDAVRVSWGFLDDLAEGTRSRPEVQCSGADDGLSPQGARLLAEVLVQAAAAAEAWQVRA